MTYFAPVITAAGLSLPAFNDIQQALLDAFQTAYGSTTYQGNDEADLQWITAVALKLFDNMNLCQLDYNSRSPQTAIGVALDVICKINGIARLQASPSTASLTLVGNPGTPISNGVIQDINGILWSLPSIVTIGSGGTVMVQAICQQAGIITAIANTITTPVGGFTAGWTSVTNPSSAIVGTPTESDSRFRARQAISTAAPSNTRLAGTIADVEAVPGVTRTNILENQLSVTDSFGNESHSITCVVEGGADLAVATAIFENRGIGPNTQGATVPTITIVDITDPVSGNVTPIGFIRPSYVTIYIVVNVHGLTSAFNTATQTAIISALTNYLASLEIGEEVTQSALYGAALAVMPNLSQPIFSIKGMFLGLTSAPTTTADLSLLFYQASQANVTLAVV
jgi:uncharacterized phage protein gp47/JayE